MILKITDVECIMLRLPEVKPVGDGTQDTLIIKVHTDEGITGLGECHTSPWVLKAIIEAPLSTVASRGLKEILIGQDPLQIRELWDRMYNLSMVYGRRGALMHALSGIDIALWDIMGKITNQPIYQLLGGKRRNKVTAYASTLVPDNPLAAIKEAQNLVFQGYSAIKFGWGGLGNNLDQDLNFVATMRKTVGSEVSLMLDIGVPLKLRDALYLAQGLAEYNVFFLEEPLSPDDIEGYKKLSELSPVSIACGEKETTRFGFRDLIERAKLDIIQPDLARAGGFTECQRIADLAELHNVTVIPHCWSNDILVAATLHYIATLKNCPYIEFCVVDNPIRRNLITNPIKMEAGSVIIPSGPGLGVELNEDIINKFRYA